MYAPGIETFGAIVRFKSLSKAAEELNLAQTTVSQRIKTLETELGFTLIERAKGFKQIRLTPEGEEFLVLAENWLHLWHEAKILRTQGPRLSLAIASVDSFNTHMLSYVYRKIGQSGHPLRMAIETMHSENIYTAIESRTVDVGYVARDFVHPNIQVSKCYCTPMVLLRLSSEQTQHHALIHPTELNSTDEISMPWGHILDNWHNRWWSPFSPSQISMDNIHLLPSFLQHPEQWAVIPLYIAEDLCQTGQFSINRFSDPPPDYVCYKLVHAQPRSMTRQSLTIFDNHFNQVLRERGFTE